MPSATNLSIYDGQSTPVAHDFAPLAVSPENTTWVNRDSDTSAGNLQVIARFSPAKTGRPSNRINLRFNMPVEHTVDGVVKVAYTARLNADVVLPEEMTQAQRDDMAAYIKNMLADTVINGYISDLDPAY